MVHETCPPANDHHGQSHVFVIRIEFHDGTARHPVMIRQNNPGWETDLEEAESHFADLYKGTGIVSIGYARNIYEAGVNDVENIVDWKEYKRNRGRQT